MLVLSLLKYYYSNSYSLFLKYGFKKKIKIKFVLVLFKTKFN